MQPVLMAVLAVYLTGKAKSYQNKMIYPSTIIYEYCLGGVKPIHFSLFCILTDKAGFSQVFH